MTGWPSPVFWGVLGPRSVRGGNPTKTSPSETGKRGVKKYESLAEEVTIQQPEKLAGKSTLNEDVFVIENVVFLSLSH